MIGNRQTEVVVGSGCRHSPPRGPIEEADLDQEWFVDILNRLFFLTYCSGNTVQSHWSTTEFVDDGPKQASIRLIEPVGMERLRPTQDGRHGLKRHPDDVVVRLLCRQGAAGGLRVKA